MCDGILYTDTNDKANIVLQRLKKSNITAMDELSKVLKFLEKRGNHKSVIEAVSQEQKQGRIIESMT